MFHVRGVHNVGGGVSCPDCGRTGFNNHATFYKHKKTCLDRKVTSLVEKEMKAEVAREITYDHTAENDAIRIHIPQELSHV